MRNGLLGAGLCCTISVTAQFYPDLPAYVGRIETARIKEYGSITSMVVDPSGARYPMNSKWRSTGMETILRFGPGPMLISQEFQLKKVTIQKVNISRDTVEGIAITRYHSPRGSLSDLAAFSKQVVLDDHGRPSQWSVVDEDSSLTKQAQNLAGFQKSAEYDAVYEDGLLRSYKHVSQAASGDTLTHSRIDLEYDPQRRVIAAVERTIGFFSHVSPETRAWVTIRPEGELLMERHNFTYDADGMLSKRMERSYGGHPGEDHKTTTMIYTFDYDDRGNWVRKYVQRDSDPVRLLAKQRIQYFED